MYRFAVILAVLATPLAAEDKQASCDTAGDIVGAVVTARAGGAEKADATSTVVKSLDGDKAKYKDAVPTIADWIYTLPQEQLTDEVGKAYVTACMTQ